MNPKKNPYLKFVSLKLAVLMIGTSIGLPPAEGWALSTAHPVTEVALQNGFILPLPPELGRVEKIVTGGGPVLVHVQTAHGNYEAQKNIQKILQYLKKQHDFKLILLEGSTVPLDPERLRFFPHHMDVTMRVNEDLVHDALVKGVELFLLEEKDVQTRGIEDRDAYMANGRAFLDVLREREKSENFLGRLDMQIERLAGPFLNTALRNFLKDLERFESRTLPMTDWLSVLKNKAGEILKIDLDQAAWQLDWPMLYRLFRLQDLESGMDAAAFKKERGAFLKQIGQKTETHQKIAELLNEPVSQNRLPYPQTGMRVESLIASLPEGFTFESYPNVARMLGHIVLQSELDPALLLQEMETLTGKISFEMAGSGEAKQILVLLHDYRMLKRLFALELTPEDYAKMIRQNRGDAGTSQAVPQMPDESALRPSVVMTRFRDLNRESRVRDLDTPLSEDEFSQLDILFGRALEFYEGVHERDRRMFEKTEAALRETGAGKAVIITGGFHAASFHDYFTNRGYSYALVSPKMTEAGDGGKAYHEAAFSKGFDLLKESTLEDLFLAAPNVGWSDRVKSSVSGRLVGQVGELSVPRIDDTNFSVGPGTDGAFLVEDHRAGWSAEVPVARAKRIVVRTEESSVWRPDQARGIIVTGGKSLRSEARVNQRFEYDGDEAAKREEAMRKVFGDWSKEFEGTSGRGEQPVRSLEDPPPGNLGSATDPRLGPQSEEGRSEARLPVFNKRMPFDYQGEEAFLSLPDGIELLKKYLVPGQEYYLGQYVDFPLDRGRILDEKSVLTTITLIKLDEGKLWIRPEYPTPTGQMSVAEWVEFPYIESMFPIRFMLNQKYRLFLMANAPHFSDADAEARFKQIPFKTLSEVEPSIRDLRRSETRADGSGNERAGKREKRDTGFGRIDEARLLHPGDDETFEPDTAPDSDEHEPVPNYNNREDQVARFTFTKGRSSTLPPPYSPKAHRIAVVVEKIVKGQAWIKVGDDEAVALRVGQSMTHGGRNVRRKLRITPVEINKTEGQVKLEVRRLALRRSEARIDNDVYEDAETAALESDQLRRHHAAQSPAEGQPSSGENAAAAAEARRRFAELTAPEKMARLHGIVRAFAGPASFPGAESVNDMLRAEIEAEYSEFMRSIARLDKNPLDAGDEQKLRVYTSHSINVLVTALQMRHMKRPAEWVDGSIRRLEQLLWADPDRSLDSDLLIQGLNNSIIALEPDDFDKGYEYLYLAVYLHDIAKYRNYQFHEAAGADIIRDINLLQPLVERGQLTAEKAELIRLAVKHHVLLGLIYSGDFPDIYMIEGFLEDPETVAFITNGSDSIDEKRMLQLLNLVYFLTTADTGGVREDGGYLTIRKTIFRRDLVESMKDVRDDADGDISEMIKLIRRDAAQPDRVHDRIERLLTYWDNDVDRKGTGVFYQNFAATRDQIAQAGQLAPGVLEYLDTHFPTEITRDLDFILSSLAYADPAASSVEAFQQGTGKIHPLAGNTSADRAVNPAAVKFLALSLKAKALMNETHPGGQILFLEAFRLPAAEFWQALWAVQLFMQDAYDVKASADGKEFYFVNRRGDHIYFPGHPLTIQRSDEGHLKIEHNRSEARAPRRLGFETLEGRQMLAGEGIVPGSVAPAVSPENAAQVSTAEAEGEQAFPFHNWQPADSNSRYEFKYSSLDERPGSETQSNRKDALRLRSILTPEQEILLGVVEPSDSQNQSFIRYDAAPSGEYALFVTQGKTLLEQGAPLVPIYTMYIRCLKPGITSELKTGPLTEMPSYGFIEGGWTMDLSYPDGSRENVEPTYVWTQAPYNSDFEFSIGPEDTRQDAWTRSNLPVSLRVREAGSEGMGTILRTVDPTDSKDQTFIQDSYSVSPDGKYAVFMTGGTTLTSPGPEGELVATYTVYVSIFGGETVEIKTGLERSGIPEVVFEKDGEVLILEYPDAHVERYHPLIPPATAAGSRDVNGDNVVSPLDALIVINDLNARGSRALDPSDPETNPRVDVNGDGFAAPLDALLIINDLNAKPHSFEAQIGGIPLSDDDSTVFFTRLGRLTNGNLTNSVDANGVLHVDPGPRQWAGEGSEFVRSVAGRNAGFEAVSFWARTTNPSGASFRIEMLGFLGTSPVINVTNEWKRFEFNIAGSGNLEYFTVADTTAPVELAGLHLAPPFFEGEGEFSTADALNALMQLDLDDETLDLIAAETAAIRSEARLPAESGAPAPIKKTGIAAKLVKGVVHGAILGAVLAGVIFAGARVYQHFSQPKEKAAVVAADPKEQADFEAAQSDLGAMKKFMADYLAEYYQKRFVDDEALVYLASFYLNPDAPKTRTYVQPTFSQFQWEMKDKAGSFKFTEDLTPEKIEDPTGKTTPAAEPQKALPKAESKEEPAPGEVKKEEPKAAAVPTAPKAGKDTKAPAAIPPAKPVEKTAPPKAGDEKAVAPAAVPAAEKTVAPAPAAPAKPGEKKTPEVQKPAAPQPKQEILEKKAPDAPTGKRTRAVLAGQPGFVKPVTAQVALASLIPRTGQGPAWRFSHDYSANDLLTSEDARTRAVAQYAYWEGQFHKPGVAYNGNSGLTHDGVEIDWDTAAVGAVRNWSADSKEALQVSRLALVVDGHEMAKLAVNPDHPEQALETALEILTIKISSYEKFNREFPGYGGYHPWFLVSDDGMVPTQDWQNRVPLLDNVLNDAAMIGLEYILRKNGHAELADRYLALLQMRRKNLTLLFYEGDGKIRAETGIRDVKAAPSAQNYYDYPRLTNGNAYYLDDPYEGDLAAWMFELYAPDFPAAEKEKIWQRKRAKLVAAVFDSKQGLITIRQGWRREWVASAHEDYGTLLLPYLDDPVFRRVFVNTHKARTWLSAQNGYPTLFASVNDVSSSPDQLSETYISGDRFDVATPYGAFPLNMLDSYPGNPQPSGSTGTGLVWTDVAADGPRMQSDKGVGEAVKTDGTAFAPVLTWDVKGMTLQSMFGGTAHLSRAAMERDGVYPRFLKVLGREYKQAFPVLQGEQIPFATPTASIPMILGDFKVVEPGSQSGVDFMAKSRWRGEGDLFTGRQLNNGILTLPAASGYLFTSVSQTDLSASPFLNLTINTSAAGRIFVEIKNLNDRLITADKIAIQVPNTQGKPQTFSFNLGGLLTASDKTAMIVVFSDTDVPLGIGPGSFSKAVPEGSRELKWDGRRFVTDVQQPQGGAVNLEIPNIVAGMNFTPDDMGIMQFKHGKTLKIMASRPGAFMWGRMAPTDIKAKPYLVVVAEGSGGFWYELKNAGEQHIIGKPRFGIPKVHLDFRSEKAGGEQAYIFNLSDHAVQGVRDNTAVIMAVSDPAGAVDISHLGFASKAELDKLIKQMQAAGIYTPRSEARMHDQITALWPWVEASNISARGSFEPVQITRSELRKGSSGKQIAGAAAITAVLASALTWFLMRGGKPAEAPAPQPQPVPVMDVTKEAPAAPAVEKVRPDSELFAEAQTDLEAMKGFVRQYLSKRGYAIKDEGWVSGFAPWYLGPGVPQSQVGHTRPFREFETEMDERLSEWTAAGLLEKVRSEARTHADAWAPQTLGTGRSEARVKVRTLVHGTLGTAFIGAALAVGFGMTDYQRDSREMTDYLATIDDNPVPLSVQQLFTGPVATPALPSILSATTISRSEPAAAELAPTELLRAMGYENIEGLFANQLRRADAARGPEAKAVKEAGVLTVSKTTSRRGLPDSGKIKADMQPAVLSQALASLADSSTGIQKKVSAAGTLGNYPESESAFKALVAASKPLNREALTHVDETRLRLTAFQSMQPFAVNSDARRKQIVEAMLSALKTEVNGQLLMILLGDVRKAVSENPALYQGLDFSPVALLDDVAALGIRDAQRRGVPDFQKNSELILVNYNAARTPVPFSIPGYEKPDPKVYTWERYQAAGAVTMQKHARGILGSIRNVFRRFSLGERVGRARAIQAANPNPADRIPARSEARTHADAWVPQTLGTGRSEARLPDGQENRRVLVQGARVEEALQMIESAVSEVKNATIWPWRKTVALHLYGEPSDQNTTPVSVTVGPFTRVRRSILYHAAEAFTGIHAGRRFNVWTGKNGSEIHLEVDRSLEPYKPAASRHERVRRAEVRIRDDAKALVGQENDWELEYQGDIPTIWTLSFKLTREMSAHRVVAAIQELAWLREADFKERGGRRLRYQPSSTFLAKVATFTDPESDSVNIPVGTVTLSLNFLPEKDVVASSAGEVLSKINLADPLQVDPSAFLRAMREADVSVEVVRGTNPQEKFIRISRETWANTGLELIPSIQDAADRAFLVPAHTIDDSLALFFRDRAGLVIKALQNATTSASATDDTPPKRSEARAIDFEMKGVPRENLENGLTAALSRAAELNAVGTVLIHLVSESDLIADVQIQNGVIDVESQGEALRTVLNAASPSALFDVQLRGQQLTITPSAGERSEARAQAVLQTAEAALPDFASFQPALRDYFNIAGQTLFRHWNLAKTAALSVLALLGVNTAIAATEPVRSLSETEVGGIMGGLASLIPSSDAGIALVEYRHEATANAADYHAPLVLAAAGTDVTLWLKLSETQIQQLRTALRGYALSVEKSGIGFYPDGRLHIEAAPANPWAVLAAFVRKSKVPVGFHTTDGSILRADSNNIRGLVVTRDTSNRAEVQALTLLFQADYLKRIARDTMVTAIYTGEQLALMTGHSWETFLSLMKQTQQAFSSAA